MKTRKIVLIAADLILLIVGILQIIAASRTTVKVFSFSEEPDKIVLEKYDGTFNLVKDGDKWVLNAEKFDVNASNVDNMIANARNISALDKVAKLNNEAVRTKYEFDADNAIKVTMSAGDKVLRTFTLGKDASTGIQCYATIENSDDVYLISGDYRNIFDKSVDQLRSKTVYSVEAVRISSVSITPADGDTWSVSRHGEAEDTVWSVSGTNITLDSSKAAEWMNSFNTLTTTKWHGTTDDIGGQPYIKCEVGAIGKNIKLDIYIVPADPEAENSSDLYYAKCSESPYWFEIPSYNVTKYQKKPEDLQK
ncbi:MAG: DUF4340 domain-containing protein [Treponema sp.]|nr:DUF4340 domain-containing protein [Treponema sp.]